MQFLGRDERKAGAKIEAHLVAEHGKRARCRYGRFLLRARGRARWRMRSMILAHGSIVISVRFDGARYPADGSAARSSLRAAPTDSRASQQQIRAPRSVDGPAIRPGRSLDPTRRVPRREPSVTLRQREGKARASAITEQAAIPPSIGTAVPSRKRPTAAITTAPVANCSVPISAEAVPAIAPCSSSASTAEDGTDEAEEAIADEEQRDHHEKLNRQPARNSAERPAPSTDRIARHRAAHHPDQAEASCRGSRSAARRRRTRSALTEKARLYCVGVSP